jgi:hypothetical protein
MWLTFSSRDFHRNQALFSGAKAHIDFVYSIGTTEVVP